MEKARKDGKNGSRQNTADSADYEPTPKERNLLEVMLNPESRMWSKTEICHKADCDRETLRKAFKKEGFVKLWDKQAKGIVQRARMSVLNACIRQAQRGDATHAKMILTMSGDYNEKRQLAGAGGGNAEITVIYKDKMSDKKQRNCLHGKPYFNGG